MRSVVVLAHPEEKSFNAQMAQIAVDTLSRAPGSDAQLLDLYRMGFEPCESGDHFPSRLDEDRFDAQAEQRHAADTDTLPADVRCHLEAVERADVLILQYPIWWYTPPAILKGWLDRVFVYGRAYTSRRRYDSGFFKGKRAMLSVSAGAPEATYAYNGRNADVDLILWPMNFTLSYLGFTVLQPFVSFGIEGGLKYSDEGDAVRRLTGYQNSFATVLENLETRKIIPFNGWEDWDDQGRLKPGVRGYSPFMRGQP